jgi:anti-sigma B factor antagonist
VIEAVDVGDTVTVLDLEGEFDMMSASAIDEHRQRVLDRGRNLIIDLSDATFIDSAVVHALFKADEAARRAGRVLVLQFGTHSVVERVLSVAGVAKTLQTARTLERAIEVIDARAA